MIVFQGLNLLNRIAYYLAQQYSLDSTLMHTTPDKTLPPPDQESLSQRWILLNQYSLNHMQLPESFGHEIHRVHVNSITRGRFSRGFQINRQSLGVPYLAKTCQIGLLNDLYPIPEHVLPHDPNTHTWCSHNLQGNPETPKSFVGFARQIILKTKGDHHCAFQIFDWPVIMGFLPISQDRTVLVYCCSDAEKNDQPLTAGFHNTMEKLLEQTTLSLEGIESIGPAVTVFSGHSVSYRQGIHGLFGEAVQRTHPLAGQGFNMGIGDALCLIHLSEHLHDHYQLIQFFEKQRWLSNSMMNKFCHQLSMSSARWWAPSLFRAFNRSESFQKNLFTLALQLDRPDGLEFIS